MHKKAYAKVNLFLNVLSKRPDGFHDLEMVNITADLADELDFDLTEGDISISTSIVALNSEDNLAYKVAAWLKRAYDVKAGVKIYIKKNIPVGGGLGGGSADAAATLEALNELWGLNIKKDELMSLAGRFGSDVPYCLFRLPAVVKGRGEIIEPADIDTSTFSLSFFSPHVAVSTKKVFENIKEPNSLSLSYSLSHLVSRDYEEFVKGLDNGLEETVFSLYPEVKEEYELLKRVYGPKGLFLTGSGSTIVKISEKT